MEGHPIYMTMFLQNFSSVLALSFCKIFTVAIPRFLKVPGTKAQLHARPNEASVPVPDGQASGPPLDGWHWEMIAWPPSGTEWSSHSRPEAGSYKHALLCPAHDQEEEEMWFYIKATAQSVAKMIRLNLHLCKSCSVISYRENLSSRCFCF